MPSASLTSKGQVTIPKAIRELLKIENGDRLDFTVEEGRVFIRPGTASLRALKGLLHRAGRKPLSLKAMDAAVARFHGRAR